MKRMQCKLITTAIILFCCSPIVFSAPYKSVFGFEYPLPKGWDVLAPDPGQGVYNNEILQTLGSENIYQNDGYGELLQQIKSGEVEYVFEKQASNVHFKNNIRMQIVNNNVRPSNEVKIRCAAIEKQLKKFIVERIEFKGCEQKQSNNLSYIEFSYYRPVIAVTTLQAEIPVTKQSKMVLSGSSNRKGLAQLRKTQAGLVKVIAKHYQAMKKVSVQAQQAFTEKRHTEALSGLNKMAEFGDAQAEYSLGLMNEKGQGMPVNQHKALKYFSAAAEKDFPAAVAKLAEAYYTGNMVERDIGKSITLYRKAAELGVASAQNKYASLLFQGIDIDKNQQEAKKWFIKAMEQGNEQATRNLLAIYKMESRWGSLKSRHALAQFYLNGTGVVKNPGKAIELLEKAGQQGYDPSRKILVRIFSEGLYGQIKNPDLALKWSQED